MCVCVCVCVCLTHRRAAYAAEDAVTRLEKDKLKQDFRIDDLQNSLKSMQQQLQLYTAQVRVRLCVRVCACVFLCTGIPCSVV